MLSSISFPVSFPIRFFSISFFLLRVCVLSRFDFSGNGNGNGNDDSGGSKSSLQRPTPTSRLLLSTPAATTAATSRQAKHNGYRRIVCLLLLLPNGTLLEGMYAVRLLSFCFFVLSSSACCCGRYSAEYRTASSFFFSLSQHDVFVSVRTTVVRCIPLDLYVEIAVVVATFFSSYRML